jgi:tRNA A37 methylthiotransferase MiaB
MPNHVLAPVARERNRILRELGLDKKRRFMHSFVGQSLQAITLRADDCGTAATDSTRAETTQALTDNYLRLHLKGRYEPNQWLQVGIHSIEGDELVGIPIS